MEPSAIGPVPAGPAEQFAEQMRRPEDAVALDEAALLLAAAVRGLDEAPVSAACAELDRLARDCPDADAAGLVHLLYEVEGFTGDRRHYADPRNSYLDQVLHRRRGIPITLAVVLTEVGRRCGVALTGIGMPGHFLVGVEASRSGVYIDPFRGQMMDRTGAEALFRALHGEGAGFRASFLDPVGPHAILARILANLRRDLAAAGDLRGARAAAHLRVLVPGVAATEWMEVARLDARLGRYRQAAEMLETLAAELPEGMAERARRDARALRARLN